MTDDERYERWLDQLERIIQEVYNAHLYRFLWRGLAEITQAADLPPSVIFDALGVWYAGAQAVNVRRQVDRSKGVVSLHRLLAEIARYPAVVSRERHLSLWGDDEDWQREGNKNYDRFSGGRERNSVDRGIVRADLASLREAANVVEQYVNEAIAHTAEAGRHTVPTFAELNAGIDTVGEVVTKYTSLLRAQILWELVPVIQYDWKAPFRQAWIIEGEVA